MHHFQGEYAERESIQFSEHCEMKNRQGKHVRRLHIDTSYLTSIPLRLDKVGWLAAGP